jgi:magnesium transporter
MASEVARPREEFFHLSGILDRPVLSPNGEGVGRLVEVGCSSGELFPRILTYYIRPGRLAPLTLAAPGPAFVKVPDRELRLAVPVEGLQPSSRRQPAEILLRREILDKQIVDTDGARVVRVNDVHLLRARGNDVRVVHVEIGFRGILRRLGWERSVVRLLTASRLLRRLAGEDRLLSWRYVVPLRAGALQHDLRLNVAQHQLGQLHPAELAEIMEELDRFEGPAMLEALDIPTAARTLAELSAEAQRLLLEALDVRRAGTLLAAMAPDEVADILEQLPDALREKLVAALPAADAKTVTGLLSFEPDTAGSTMNPEVFAVAPGTTVREIRERLRGGPAELVQGYAVLVVDGERRLSGFIPLQELVRAHSPQLVDEVMDTDPVTVHPEESMDEVADLFDRFNLLSMPVVDHAGRLEGVLTVDDVLAWLREGEGREGRLT